jgi:hypothetical protein
MLLRFFRCPTCFYLTKIDIGFEDILGPPVVVCKHCQNEIKTGLQEWDALRKLVRIQYVLVSMIAIIFGSYFLAASLYILLTNNLFSDLAWSDYRFLALYSAAVLLTAVLKIEMVRLSRRRVQTDCEVVEASLLTWHMNFGLYYAGTVIILILVGYNFVKSID